MRSELHLLEGGVALHEFLGAAAWETDRELAVFIIAFDADDGTDAIVGVADFLAEERIAVFAALCGRTREGARAGRTPRSSRSSRGRSHAAKKFFGRVGILRVGFVASSLADLGHGASDGLDQFAGNFGEKTRG